MGKCLRVGEQKDPGLSALPKTQSLLSDTLAPVSLGRPLCDHHPAVRGLGHRHLLGRHTWGKSSSCASISGGTLRVRGGGRQQALADPAGGMAREGARSPAGEPTFRPAFFGLAVTETAASKRFVKFVFFKVF